jgi:outer membrane protein insertion porin family
MRLSGAAFLILAAAIGVNAASIRDVAIVNAGKFPLDEPSVRAHIKTVAGSEYDQNALSADVRKLLDTGRYESVEVAAEKVADGMRVVFSVRPNRRLVGEVVVVGAREYSEERVREWLGIHDGDDVSDAILGAHTQKILDEYRDALYADVEVTWSMRDVKPDEGRVEVTLNVQEGDRAWIQSAEFPGAKEFSTAKLKEALNMRAWYNPMRLFRRDHYDMSDIDLGRLTIKEWYADLGYLDVSVGRPEVAKHTRGGLSVSVPVVEGPRYRIGKVILQGIERFPEAELYRAADLVPGAVAAASAVDEAAQRVRSYYGSRGYVDAVVQPALGADPAAGTVDVRLVVREGEQVKIRNIRIRGNAVTRDKVIRRELAVYPGDIMNDVEAARSERRLLNLGFFSSVRHYPEETSISGERDLVYELEEGRAGQMMLGAGFSSIDHLMFFLNISHGNFDIGGWPYRGAGQKLKLDASIGGVRRDVSISFTEPWFMDRRLQLGTELYFTDDDYSDYVLKHYGAALSLTKGLFGRVRGTVTYRIERERVTSVADTNAYMFVYGPEDTNVIEYASRHGGTNSFPFAEVDDMTSSSLRLGLSYDDRDHPFIPRNGLQASAYVQVSGGALGADSDIYQAGFKAAYYVSPWFGHVFSVQASYDTVDSYGETDEVPISSRLFAGGGRTIRGFGYRDVGPKVAPVSGASIDPLKYRPFGGLSRAVGNVEYTIPLFSMLRLATFYDTGNVWGEPRDMEWGNLAASAGVGLRFDLPGFPIRIDRAWVLHKDDPLTREDMVVFWIGY